MQIIKIILGVIIGISALIEMISSFKNNTTGGILGAVIGCSIFIGISYWLISSALKNIDK